MPTQRKSRKQADVEDAASVTFSTRFSQEQRDRIVEAAAVRGWSPANLMRVATLEKAAHILNTSKQTKFDFKGLAHQIAVQLSSPEAKVFAHEGEYPAQVDLEEIVGPGVTASVQADCLSLSVLSHLKRAAQLGGSEFLALVIENWEGLTASENKDLPEPINPL